MQFANSLSTAERGGKQVRPEEGSGVPSGLVMVRQATSTSAAPQHQPGDGLPGRAEGDVDEFRICQRDLAGCLKDTFDSFNVPTFRSGSPS